jgi:anti-sigma-K factor RskA
MTDRTPPIPGDAFPDDDDLLAAEYVMGTLDPDTWRAARDRAEADGAFAARVRDWEGRLAPLNAAYPEAPVPPAALAGIEARLFPAPRPAPRRSWLAWTAGALIGGAVAAGLLLVVPFGPFQPIPVVAPQPLLQATLQTDDGALVFAARFDPAAGRLQVIRQSGTDAATGQDYELWAIDDSGVPRSLGLLRGAEVELTAALAEGVTLAISLEPEGGSPDPVPSGPVLGAAPLAAG